jgi:hypothetical protein
LAVVAAVVAVDAGALVVDAALDDAGEGDELHAASKMAAGAPITTPTTPRRGLRCNLGCGFMGPP